MTIADLKFTGQATGLDELAGAPGLFANVMPDLAGVLRARPGIRAWDLFPATAPDENEVVGIHHWKAADGGKGAVIWITQGEDGVRRIYAIDSGGVLYALSGALGTTLLDGTLRPKFIETSTLLVIVGGGAPQKITLSLNSERLGGSPPNAIDGVVITRRIVLASADGTGRMYWSDILETGSETWDTAFEFREAEAQADPLIALAASSRFLFGFGADTIQGFAPDPTETFTPAVTIDEGVVSGSCVVNYGSTMGWVSATPRRIFLSDPFAFSQGDVISTAIAKDIEGLSTASDCWTFRETMQPHDVIGFVFPTDARAFCYDLNSKAWHERRGFSGGLWKKWMATAHAQFGAKYLIGTADGRIMEITRAATTDDGDAIKCVARGGFVSYDTSNFKHGHLTLTARRGEAASEDSVISVKWRDDLGAFCKPINRPLGVEGDVKSEMVVRPFGAPYQQRQTELSWTAADVVAIAKVREYYGEHAQ